MSQSTISDPQLDAGAWLASVVENSDDAILSKTLEGIITSWNAGAEKLFGYSREEAIGKPITLIIPEDRLHEETDIIAKLRAGKRVERFETVRRRSDGEPVYLEVTISPVRDASGTIIGASKIARDIGERKRHAEEQKLLVREMQHRIKNLLSIVKGLISVCRRQAKDVDDFVDDLSSRIAALDAAQHLVLQRPEAGEPSVTVSDVVGAVLAPYLGDRNVTVEASGAILVGPHATTSLALSLHELATNAVKYGALSNPNGRLAIAISERGETIVIDWRERGGMDGNGEEGFGTELLRAVLRGFGGKVEQGWERDERVVTISLPRAQLAT